MKRKPLEDGLTEAVNEIESKLKEQRRLRPREPFYVLIGGGSGSGKTNKVTARLAEIFGDRATVLSADNYYHGNNWLVRMAELGHRIGWDDMSAINHSLLIRHAKLLRAGKSVPEFSYSKISSEKTCTGRQKEPKEIIIIEGLFALARQFNFSAYRIFVDVGMHGRLMRRLLRDLGKTNQTPAEIINYFCTVVQPRHERYIQKTLAYADMVLENEFVPHIEAKRTGNYQRQMKFYCPLDFDPTLLFGANLTSATKQVDHYLDLNNGSLGSQGEILRIREEEVRLTLTYKGPKEKSASDIFRFIQEVEIDRSIVSNLMMLYQKIATIKKTRFLYSLNGNIFSLDAVEKDGQRLGKFIEIRKIVHPKAINLGIIEIQRDPKIFKFLGVKPGDAILKSYIEM